MPLSKARDKERKRLIRLESKNVQPKRLYPVQPKDMKSRLGEQGIAIDGNKIISVQPKPLPNCPDGRYREVDADGNSMPDF